VYYASAFKVGRGWLGGEGREESWKQVSQQQKKLGPLTIFYNKLKIGIRTGLDIFANIRYGSCLLDSYTLWIGLLKCILLAN
jgi:hypothetical protein